MFLEISQNSQENTCARVSFLIKLRPATLLKKRLWQRCFCINFAKFLRTPFLQNTSGRLLLFRYIYFGKSAVKVLIKYRGSNWYYYASANSTSQSGEYHENKGFNNDKFKSLKEPNLSGRTFFFVKMKIKVLKFFFEKLSRVDCRPRKYVKSVMTFQSCRTFFKTRHFTFCKIGMRNLPRKVFKLLQIESGIPNHGGRFNIQRLN